MDGAEGNVVDVFDGFVCNKVIFSNSEDMPQKDKISFPIPLRILPVFLIDNGTVFRRNAEFNLSLHDLRIPFDI